MINLDDLKTLLRKPANEWTDQERLLVAKSNVELGRAQVKAIRDELSDIQLVPLANGEMGATQHHETLETMAVKGEVLDRIEQVENENRIQSDPSQTQV